MGFQIGQRVKVDHLRDAENPYGNELLMKSVGKTGIVVRLFDDGDSFDFPDISVKFDDYFFLPVGEKTIAFFPEELATVTD